LQWYEDEVRQLDNACPREAGDAIFYGSSSIRLWDTLKADFAPVAGGRRLLNLGFGGSTLAACDHFFDRLVAPRRPASIIFYAGENDLGDGQTPDQVVQSFRHLHEKVAALPGDIPFAFLSIKPAPGRAPVMNQIREVNRRIQPLLATRPQSLWIDVHVPMLDATGAPLPILFAPDGVHLTPAGYRLWTDVVTPFAFRIFPPFSPRAEDEEP